MERPLLPNDEVNAIKKDAIVDLQNNENNLLVYLFEKYLSRLKYRYLSIENILEKDPLFYDIICQHILMLSHSIKFDYNIGFLSIADGNLFHDIYFPVSYTNKKKSTRSKMGGTSILNHQNKTENGEVSNEKSETMYKREAELTKSLFRQMQYLYDDFGMKVIIQTYIAILCLIKNYHDIQNTLLKSNSSLDVDPNVFSSKIAPFNDVHKDARIYFKTVSETLDMLQATITEQEAGEKGDDALKKKIDYYDSYQEVKWKYCCCCRCGIRIITYPLEEDLIKEIYILLNHMEVQLFQLLEEPEEDS